MNDTQLIEGISDIILRISYAKASYGYSAEDILEYFDTASDEQIADDYFEDLILENNVSDEYIIEQTDIVMEGIGSFLLNRAGISLLKKLLPKRIANKLSVGKIIKKVLPATALTAGTVAVLNPELAKKAVEKATGTTAQVVDSVKTKVKELVPDLSSGEDKGEDKEGGEKEKGKESTSSGGGMNPVAKPEPESISPRQRQRERKYAIMKGMERMEAYDIVLDYLLSEGHAETVEEANYVMMQMDSEHIQSVVNQK